MVIMKKNMRVVILLLAFTKLHTAETPDIAKIVASLSPDLHKLSPDTFAYLEEKRKIVKIPVDLLPDDYTIGMKYFFGLGIRTDRKEAVKYLYTAYKTDPKKYGNAYALIGIAYLDKREPEKAFKYFLESWQNGRSYWALSRILLLGMVFYDDPQYKDYKEYLSSKMPAIKAVVIARAQDEPDLQYILAYSCFACNRCELFDIDELSAWTYITSLINTYKHLPALELCAAQSLFDENKELQTNALGAARVANNLEMPMGHYFYGVAVCSGLVQGKTFDEGIELIKTSLQEEVYGAYSVLGNFALQGLDDNGNQTEVDYEKALSYFKQGAERGDLVSQYNLANLYFKGLGTEPNPSKGEELLKDIFAKKAYCDAQLNVVKGLVYQYGVGSYKQDLQKAKEFYQRAGLSSGVKKLIKEVNFEIAEKTRAALLAQETEAAASSSSKKTAKQKIKLEALSVAEKELPIKEEASAAVSEDINLAAQLLISKLNSSIMYDDGSLITAFDIENRIVTINDPVNNSKAIINLEKLPAVNDKMLKDVQKFTYQKRVQNYFTDQKNLLNSNKAIPETVIRHAFPERIDQIVQLYGKKFYFKTGKGTIKNYALFGKIILADGTEYKGAFEYAFSDNSESIIYHRFLHPRSRIQQSYPRA